MPSLNPLGIASLPAEVINALRVLPVLAEQLERIASHTDELPAMREGIEGVERDTAHLESVSSDTSALHSLKEQMGAMDNRMASIEEAMPVLVEVQQHLAQLPEAIETLQSGIDRMCGLIEGLLTSMDRLDGDVGSLQQVIEPVARVADKLPGGNRRSD